MQNGKDITDREIKAVILDMDNTLFDFVEAKLKACAAVVGSLGLTDEMVLLEYFLMNPRNVEDLRSIVRYLQDRNIYTKDTYEKCVKIYEKVKIENIQLYDGVIITLEKLWMSDLKLAVVTDAYENNTTARLKKTGLMKYFDVVVTGDVTGKKKPDPEPIIYALNKLSVDPTETVLVGDSLIRDIEPGKKLGMLTVYAAYGDRNFFEDRECKADFVIQNIVELLEILGINS